MNKIGLMFLGLIPLAQPALSAAANCGAVAEVTPPSFSSVSTSAGASRPGAVDGVGAAALLNRPHGIARDRSGLIYFADRGNHQIRTFDPESLDVRTIAGSGQPGFANGNRLAAAFNQPIAVVAAQDGTVYVADRDNHRIRRIDAAGAVTTLAGTGVAGFTDGPAAQAQFRQPYGVALDPEGKSLLVADYLNHAIRKIDLQTMVVTTPAGNGTAGNIDGTGGEARFNQPYNIKGDGMGNYYVPDQLNHSIRKLTQSGMVLTIAGNGSAGYADGSATQGQFNNPTGLALGAGGEIFVADRNNHRIRKITRDGAVSTLAGTGVEGDLDGSLTESQFKRPIDLVYDLESETLIVSEENGHRIRTVR